MILGNLQPRDNFHDLLRDNKRQKNRLQDMLKKLQPDKPKLLKKNISECQNDIGNCNNNLLHEKYKRNNSIQFPEVFKKQNDNTVDKNSEEKRPFKQNQEVKRHCIIRSLLANSSQPEDRKFQKNVKSKDKIKESETLISNNNSNSKKIGKYAQMNMVSGIAYDTLSNHSNDFSIGETNRKKNSYKSPVKKNVRKDLKERELTTYDNLSNDESFNYNCNLFDKNKPLKKLHSESSDNNPMQNFKNYSQFSKTNGFKCKCSFGHRFCKCRHEFTSLQRAKDNNKKFLINNQFIRGESFKPTRNYELISNKPTSYHETNSRAYNEGNSKLYNEGNLKPQNEVSKFSNTQSVSEKINNARKYFFSNQIFELVFHNKNFVYEIYCYVILYISLKVI